MYFTELGQIYLHDFVICLAAVYKPLFLAVPECLILEEHKTNVVVSRSIIKFDFVDFTEEKAADGEELFKSYFPEILM